MNFSGTLEETNLADLFQRLSDARSTGVMRVRGPGDRSKVIEMTGGEIAVVTRGEGKRPRLGELLIARGLLNREQLEQALKAQRFHGRRFGEVLVEMGLCKPSDIDECVRFQIEEDIADLFTWEKGTIDFREGEALSPGGPGDTPTRLNIDAGAVMVEAARRAEALKGSYRLVPSLNCVFRLTQHGQKLRDAATRGGRRLLDLIDEGYNVDAIVARTFVGRFGVMRALSELMHTDAVREVPREELAAYAEELRRGRRHEQAVGVYRRLLEVCPDPRQRPLVQREIEQCQEALAALAATQRIEETRVIPRQREGGPPQEAPGGFRARWWRPLTAALVLVLIVLFGITVFSVPAVRRIFIGERLAAFNEAKVACGRKVAAGEYGGAVAVWQRFIDEHPQSTEADLARGELETAQAAYEKLVSNELSRAGKLDAELDFAGAAALYGEIIEKYPDFPGLSDIRNRLEVVLAKQKAQLSRLTEEQIARRLEEAERQEKSGRVTEAYEVYKEVAAGGGASAERARAAAARLDEVLRRSLAQFEAGLAHEKNGDYKLALAAFNSACDEWPDSKWARQARNHLSSIKSREAFARLLFEDARKLEEAGRIDEALRKYLIVAQNYAGFDEAAPAREKMELLTGITKKADELLSRAAEKERLGDLDGAFEVYSTVLRNYGGTSVAAKIRLPVAVHSLPEGAGLSSGGAELGRTPVEIRVSPDEKLTLSLSLDGFEPCAQEVSRARQRSIVIPLKKKPVFAAQIGLAATGEPAFGARSVFVPAGRQAVALEAASGRELWRSHVLGVITTREDPERPGRLLAADDPGYSDLRGRAAFHGGRVFFAARDGRLHALDAATGSPALAVDLGSPADGGVEVSTSPALTAGKTLGYVATWKGELLAVDLVGGEVVWRRPLGGPVVAPPARAGDVLVYCTLNGRVVGVAAGTGERSWEATVGGRMTGGAAARGARVAVWSEDSGLAVLGLRDGAVCARRAERLQAPAFPACGESAVALVQPGGAVSGYAAEGLNSQPLWQVGLDGGVSAAPVATDRRLYAATAKGAVWCLSMDSGATLWRFDAGSAVSGPLTIHDGVLYFGTAKGTFFALAVE